MAGIELEHNDSIKYLGVTLHRSLTYKEYCKNTRNMSDNIPRQNYSTLHQMYIISFRNMQKYWGQ